MSCFGMGRGTGVRRRSILALVLVVFANYLVPVGRAKEQSKPPTEQQVKAALIFNFARFVEWPWEAFARPDSPIVIGVLGDDSFAAILEETFRGKTIHGRSFVIERWKYGHNVRSCHILFVSSSQGGHLRPILESLEGSSVLTIGETARFAHRGGVINLFLQDERVQFEINVDAAARGRLKISSKLLAFARIVPADSSKGKN